MAEFDTQKGAFLLVAMIIATMMILLLLGMGTCTYLAVIGHAMPVCTDLKEFGKELLTMAFTAAIAFAGGRMSAPYAPPPPRLPKPEKPSPKPPKPPTSVHHGDPKPPVLPDLK
jgi:hypothetical protein